MLQRAAAAACAHQSYPPGTLYLVATPIGNLADLTLRAIHVLTRVDAVACEDTRVTGQLLAWLGIDKPLRALHAHNENSAAEAIVQQLSRGESVAYLSDAGTPGISDPGARLVAAAVAAGHRVVPIPGPSSAVAALSVAGDLHGAGFRFVGFLPAKGTERRRALQALAAEAQTVVLFESPHRIVTLIDELAHEAPGRAVSVARELTKQFETVFTAPAAQLPAWLAADEHRRRGEFVLVLHALPAPAAAAAALDVEAMRCLRTLLRDLPLKQAVGLAAELSGAPRNLLYDEALRLRDAAADG